MIAVDYEALAWTYWRELQRLGSTLDDPDAAYAAYAAWIIAMNPGDHGNGAEAIVSVQGKHDE